MKTIGILALQGDIAKHASMVEKSGCKAVLVRYTRQLTEIDGLIIPGGESTTIGKLLVRFELLNPLISEISRGLPVFGTCAGLILLAKNIENSEQPRLGFLDITVARNAYGPQIESFEADIRVPAVGDMPLRAVFIRAPVISAVSPAVDVLASYEERPVFIRQGMLLGASFHPELTDDMRIHRFFGDMV